MKFSAFLVFSLIWATLVYDPLAHMVWGGGVLGARLGALDFAGGTVVHISSGTSALICALVLGKRLGYGSEPMPPHNMPFVLVGAALLWFGWFGFNAGSALAANGLAASAFVATNTATAAAALSWMAAEWLGRGKPTVLGAASGAVAGLVAITPASGFVAPMPALAIGIVAGVLCYGACNLKTLLGRYDDALDVVGVHGVGGTWGAIATGLWASKAVNPIVTTQGALVSGGLGLVGVQVIAVLATYALAIVGTLLALGITSALTGGIRVNEDDEYAGLDLSQHSETAYVFAAGGYGTASSELFAPRPVERRAVARKVME
jgi:Amt family ammonium transporter